MHWMYQFERLMKILKGHIRNRNFPKSCIVEFYITEETIEFCPEYIESTETIGVLKPCDSGSKDIGVGNPKLMIRDDLEQAHKIVLENSAVIQPYIQ